MERSKKVVRAKKRFSGGVWITSSRHIRDLLESGIRVGVPPLVICYQRARLEEGGRGVILSRGLRGAVARNLVKRRIKEIIRKNPAMLPQGFDVLVIAQAGSEKMKSRELESLIRLASEKVSP